MDILDTMNISAGGMRAESVRMRVAAENIANADSVQSANGSGPYRAKVVDFKTVLDGKTRASNVQATMRQDTTSPLRPVYQPASSMADSNGFVMYPNVDVTIENLNMKEAQRSYEANMAVLTNTKEMATRTLDMLK
jgi:flagellar basal-body rod protein FlgC